MFRKFAFYGIGVAICLAFVCSTQWGELKFPSDSLRAEVGREDQEPERVVFLTDYDEAREIAARENKPTLLFFMAKNCRYSRAMLEGAFLDLEVRRLSNEFVCVELDVNEPENEKTRDMFKVSSSPTVQFTAANGAPLQKLACEQSADRLAEQMRAVLASVAWRAANLREETSIWR